MANKNIEQQIKNSILDWIALYPRKGFAWSVYNGAVYDPKIKMFRKRAKWHRKGVSDICGIWCGKPLFIEVKTPGEVPSPEQVEFLAIAHHHGAIAFCTSSLQYAVNQLHPYDVPTYSSIPRPLPLAFDSED